MRKRCVTQSGDEKKFCTVPPPHGLSPFTMPEPNHSRHAANPHTDATTMFTHSSAPRARREARPCALFLCRIVRPSRAFAPKHLLERHESGRLGGADTGATVGDGLVSDGELAKVVAAHLRLQQSNRNRHDGQTAATTRPLGLIVWPLSFPCPAQGRVQDSVARNAP